VEAQRQPDIVEKTSIEHYMYHSPIQLDGFSTDVHMRRIDLARNMRRFYRLSVQGDLFGRASLVREWGRIGFRGQMMVETHPDEGKAVTALMKLAAVKKRRGYVD
jgi:predicted DNA-binding WGR domain protein